ncbi:MAG: CHAT domain-containing protein, partial [Vicinamibacterales bacterium]
SAPADFRTADYRHSLLGHGSRALEPLPGTRREATDIAALLSVGPWLGDQVREGRLKQCRSPVVLHLATHGMFLEDEFLPWLDARGRLAAPYRDLELFLPPRLENPMHRSMVCLAGAQTFLDGGTLPAEAEDGLLTAEDVGGMDLTFTELVVLSACDTGRGEVKVGEGVFGLRRAFAVAGARTLVMSLWKVPDEVTHELMVQFYKELQAGRSRIDALRAARQWVRWSHPDPYFWGAFILQGDAISPLALTSS